MQSQEIRLPDFWSRAARCSQLRTEQDSCKLLPAPMWRPEDSPAFSVIQLTKPAFELLARHVYLAAIGGKVTDVTFFVPGGGNVAATVNGFAAVFSDVDQPNGSGPAKKRGNRNASTLIEYYGTDGRVVVQQFRTCVAG